MKKGFILNAFLYFLPDSHNSFVWWIPIPRFVSHLFLNFQIKVSTSCLQGDQENWFSHSFWLALLWTTDSNAALARERLQNSKKNNLSWTPCNPVLFSHREMEILKIRWKPSPRRHYLNTSDFAQNKEKPFASVWVIPKSALSLSLSLSRVIRYLPGSWI